MTLSKIEQVKKTLSKKTIHEEWKQNYRNQDNEVFFKLAFEYIGKKFGIPKKSLLLDAGCGSCNHSIRLAKYGFNVLAVDYSKYIIDKANRIIDKKNFSNKIKVKQEDILNLSFKKETFDYILCWGVLMHIPNIDKAISELSRVLNKNGILIISEVNMSSLEIKATEFLRKFLKKDHVRSIKTDAGIENWLKTESGNLLSRKANIPWLIQRFKKENIIILEIKSGQFTELYTRTSINLIKSLIHKFNNFLFKYFNFHFFSCGNIIVFKKH